MSRVGKGFEIRFYTHDAETVDWWNKQPKGSRGTYFVKLFKRGLGVSDEELLDVKEVLAENVFALEQMRDYAATHRHQYNTLAEKVYRESDDHKQQIERMREEQEELKAHVEDLIERNEELSRQLNRQFNTRSFGEISVEEMNGILQNKFVSMSRRLEKIESMLMKPVEE